MAAKHIKHSRKVTLALFPTTPPRYNNVGLIHLLAVPISNESNVIADGYTDELVHKSINAVMFGSFIAPAKYKDPSSRSYLPVKVRVLSYKEKVIPNLDPGVECMYLHGEELAKAIANSKPTTYISWRQQHELLFTMPDGVTHYLSLDITLSPHF